MIVILTGPIASGKTTTAWGLLKIFNNMVFLDCNWFAAMQPFSWDKKSDIVMIYEILARMIDFHVAQGKKRFVITCNSQMAAAYKEFSSLLSLKKMPIYAFRLVCDNQTLLKRIDLKNHSNKKHEELSAILQQKFFDTMFSQVQPFLPVVVGNANESELVRKIRTMINEYESLVADSKKLKLYS